LVESNRYRGDFDRVENIYPSTDLTSQLVGQMGSKNFVEADEV
jgi:hypothetical protein